MLIVNVVEIVWIFSFWKSLKLVRDICNKPVFWLFLLAFFRFPVEWSQEIGYISCATYFWYPLQQIRSERFKVCEIFANIWLNAPYCRGQSGYINFKHGVRDSGVVSGSWLLLLQLTFAARMLTANKFTMVTVNRVVSISRHSTRGLFQALLCWSETNIIRISDGHTFMWYIFLSNFLVLLNYFYKSEKDIKYECGRYGHIE